MKQNYFRNLLLVFLISMFGLQTTYAQCGLDIYVLNDNSGSVDATEYRQSKEFITRLAAEFLPLGTANNQTRIAIGDFAEKDSFIQFDFPIATTQYATNFSDIVYYENASRILSGGTDINDAVEEASLVSGLPVIPGRNVAQVLVILTDAYPSQVAPSIIAFANTLKSKGFEIVVMAIDDAVNDAELPQIVSPGGYFTAGNYQTLEDNVITYAKNLALQACNYEPPVPTPDLNVTLSNFNIANCSTTATSSVNYQVNNVGNVSFSGNLYISLYDADPRTPGANLVGAHNAGATTITAGGVYSGAITNTNVAGLFSASNLFAVVNFNGNQAGNQVPVAGQLSQSQLAITTPVAEKITTNNFSPKITVTLGAGCNMGVLDMKVSSSGGACDDEVTYTIQVCNNGGVSATLDGLLVAPAPGFSLVSASRFCTGDPVFQQLGQTLNGVAANDEFSVSALSSDGHTIVTSGLLMDNGAVTNAGAAKIYDYNKASALWVQRGQTIYGSTAGDWLGKDNDISSNGNRIIVGSPGKNGTAGAALVYDWNGTVWQQVGNIINGTGSDDQFGNGVAISADGQTIMVSANHAVNEAGRVEVYRLVGATWTQMGTDFIGIADDNLGNPSWPKGIDISSDGKRIFMGGLGIDTSGFTDNGQVRIYDWDGATWVAKPFSNGLNTDDWYGWGVSATSDGNAFASLASTQSGNNYIRVFTWNGSSWAQKGINISLADIYSMELSETGNRLVVGSKTTSYLYEFDGTQWVQIETFGGIPFAYNSSINGDGSVVSFGDEAVNSSRGSIQVFAENGCIIAPGECKTVEYVYNVTAAAAGTYDFDVVLNASKTLAAHANPVINPDKNFLTQNNATTGSGWDGSKHAEENATIFGAAFCSTTHTIGIATTLSPAAVCVGSYTTATVTITNPYPISITGTNLVLNLGNGAIYASEPYNISGIVMPTFPGLNGTTGSKTIPVYTLAPGANTFQVDIAVAAGTNTFTAQLINIDPAYNNGSASTAVISKSATGQANPTFSGTCPATVTFAATTISLNYTVTGASTRLWNSGTNGVFSNPSSGITTYTINSQDRANGFVDFTLTAVSATGCDSIINCRVNITGVSRDYGDAPISYDLGGTTIPVAAAHSIKAGLHLGVLAPDAETANQPSVNANLEAEDDGLTITNIAAVGGTTYKLPVSVTNTTSTIAYANAFIDWNKDGDFLDVMETGATVTVPPTSGTQTYMVNFDVPSGVAINDLLYIRLRVSEDESAVRRSFAAAGGGEVEDFYLSATASCTAGLDSDGDGTSDVCDLDDDNDGILDTVENNCTNPNLITNGDFASGATSWANSYNAGPNSTSNVQFTSGLMQIQVDNAGNLYPGNVLLANTTAFSLVTGQTYKFSSDLHVYAASANVNFSWVLINSSGTIVQTIETYKTLASGTGNVLITNTATAYPKSFVSNVSRNYRLAMTWVTNSSPSGNAHDVRVDNVNLSSGFCDLDGDGIPNHLDLDSDNDGCVDAIEGAGSFTASQLTTASGTVTVGFGSSATNQNFGTTVDANGIPTTVGASGQGLGDSQNSAVNSCPAVDPDCSSLYLIIDSKNSIYDITGLNGTLPSSFRTISSLANQVIAVGKDTSVPSKTVFTHATGAINSNVYVDNANTGVQVPNFLNGIAANPTDGIVYANSAVSGGGPGNRNMLRVYPNPAVLGTINGDTFFNNVANTNLATDSFFDTNGKYYIIAFNNASASTDKRLYSVDLSTLQATFVMNITGTPANSRGLQGLAFLNGKIYMAINEVFNGGNQFKSIDIYETNPNTGSSILKTTYSGIQSIFSGGNYQALNIDLATCDSYVPSYCYKPGILDVGNTFPTKHGITALGRAGAENENWPMVRQSAWTVLESKEKGFVVNRVATTANLANITNPVEGMMVYDEEADCLKIYTLKSGDTVMGWHCFTTPACPD